MSEPVSKQRPMIDLDEFERRLGRPAPAAKNNGDPLAELARLVGNTEDRFKNIFQAAPSTQERKPPELGWPARKNARQPEPSPADNAQQRINLGGDFAAIEAGLLGTIAPEAETHIASAPNAPPAAQAYAEPAPAYPNEEEDADHWLDAPYAPQAAAPRPAPEPPRSRLPLYATAAIILVGVAGIGGTFALKRSPKGPHEIATIKALTGPTKVQASAATDSGKNDASILDKSPEPKPTATVNRTEQPVDLAATQPTAPSPPPEPTPTSAQETPTPQPSAPPSPQGSSPSPSPQATQPMGVDTAAEVPVPPPPAAGSMAGQAFGLAGVIEPRKVRTVAVRPDGTLVSNDAGSGPVSSISPPMPSQAPTQQAPEQKAPAPQTPPPSSDASQTGDSAKTTARIEQPSQQPTDNGGASPAAPPASAPSDNASPPNSAPKATDAKPTDVAESDTSNVDNAQHAASREGGVFSVQLAASPTEDEARQTMAHLQGHYGSVLKGHRLKYHFAKVADKKVFRVRVSGLSHEQATTLCQKLQAKGGSCFVAKN